MQRRRKNSSAAYILLRCCRIIWPQWLTLHAETGHPSSDGAQNPGQPHREGRLTFQRARDAPHRMARHGRAPRSHRSLKDCRRKTPPQHAMQATATSKTPDAPTSTKTTKTSSAPKAWRRMPSRTTTPTTTMTTYITRPAASGKKFKKTTPHARAILPPFLMEIACHLQTCFIHINYYY